MYCKTQNALRKYLFVCDIQQTTPTNNYNNNYYYNNMKRKMNTTNGFSE